MPQAPACLVSAAVPVYWISPELALACIAPVAYGIAAADATEARVDVVEVKGQFVTSGPHEELQQGRKC